MATGTMKKGASRRCAQPRSRQVRRDLGIPFLTTQRVPLEAGLFNTKIQLKHGRKKDMIAHMTR